MLSDQKGHGARMTVCNAVSRRLWPLESNSLCGEARARTRLEEFGDPAIEGRLSVLVDSIESEANLHPLGRLLTRMHLRDLLETRLALAEVWRRTDAGESVQRPVFITGMPRSGSTFLHELLAQDSNNRAPCVWEVMFPVAAIRREPRATRRSMQRAAVRLWWFRRITPRADSICPLRASGAHECVTIHSYTLLSHEFVIMFRVPSYRVFLRAADVRPAYQWQKEFLQRLQARGCNKQWVLKSPDHVFALEALFKAFPDALVIQTHRDPMEVLQSCIRMVDGLQRTFARQEEIHRIAAREALALAEGMERITQFRENHPELADRFVDVHYRQLVAEPVATIQRVYAQLDLPLDSKTMRQVRNLACSRSRYRQPPHLSLRQLGLEPQAEKQRFRNYCMRFGIQHS